MFKIHLKKERVAYFLNCLNSPKGDLIAPVKSKRWTACDMLALAGACFFCISSHERLVEKRTNETESMPYDSEKLSPEHKEAFEEMIFEDIHTAIEFVSELTKRVYYEEYDEAFEDFVECEVTQEGEVSRQIVPITGFKA